MHIKRILFLSLLGSSISMFGQLNRPEYNIHKLLPFTQHVFGVSFKMVPVEGGIFDMGSNSGEKNNQPVHQVRETSFYMSSTEVTFQLYDLYCKQTKRGLPYDGGFGRGNYPVINVSWFDAMKFCQWLKEQTGMEYTLPTEAQWEYAARSGKKNERYDYAGGNNIDSLGWYWHNSQESPEKVATKAPNSLGIYDLSGNVWEWCLDSKRSYSKNKEKNPCGPISGDKRISRGGSWGFYPQYCRVFYRDSYRASERYSDLGIRLVCTNKPQRPRLNKMQGITTLPVLFSRHH